MWNSVKSTMYLIGSLLLQAARLLGIIIVIGYFFSFLGYAAIIMISATHPKLAIVLGILNTLFLLIVLTGVMVKINRFVKWFYT